MILLGIDISQNSTGYAVLIDAVPEKTGYIKNPTGQSLGEYLVRIRDHVQYLIQKYNVDAVVVEDLFIQFNKTGKAIYQLHGVVKEVVYRETGKEAAVYPQQTWRFKMLGLKNFTKDEKAELEEQAKAIKGTRYKTYFKHLCDIKHKVIEYVNNRLGTKYKFEENDITDAIGIALAHYDKVKK